MMSSTETLCILFFFHGAVFFSLLFALSSVKALIITSALVTPQTPALPQAFPPFIELKHLSIHLFANVWLVTQIAYYQMPYRDNATFRFFS